MVRQEPLVRARPSSRARSYVHGWVSIGTVARLTEERLARCPVCPAHGPRKGVVLPSIASVKRSGFGPELLIEMGVLCLDGC